MRVAKNHLKIEFWNHMPTLVHDMDCLIEPRCLRLTTLHRNDLVLLPIHMDRRII